MDPEVSPVIQRLHRIPLALKDEGTAELQMMLAMGVIDQSMLPPGSPTWSLSEKSLAEYESVWTCIWHLFPTSTLSPRMRSWPLTSMGRRSLLSYTCAKVTCRCHSIRPAETSQCWSHTGVYRYTSMPFGLSAAPSCFQKMMTTILAGFPTVAVFLDDIVVRVAEIQTHNDRLNRVASAFMEHNFTLNAEKYKFATSAIDFVGFRLTSTSQVASFLGMTAYYLRFLPQYSWTTVPLRHLLKTDEPWNWTAECSEAIQNLKSQLTTPPILAHFDPEIQTLVTWDASTQALGAVLSQEQGTQLLLTSYLKRDLAKKAKKQQLTTLICLVISVLAKVLRDPLVQYSRGLNWYGYIDKLAVLARGGASETPSKPFTNHNAVGQLTNHNTFCFSEGGPSSNPELIESFVSGWGERYYNNVNYVKNTKHESMF